MLPYPSDRMILNSEYDRGYANGQKDAEAHICPFYEIDDDGHGVCKNVRYETVTEFADRCRECGREKVLDKIRAEIEELADADGYGDYQLGFSFGLMMAMEIIDKYKAVRGD